MIGDEVRTFLSFAAHGCEFRYTPDDESQEERKCRIASKDHQALSDEDEIGVLERNHGSVQQGHALIVKGRYAIEDAHPPGLDAVIQG